MDRQRYRSGDDEAMRGFLSHMAEASLAIGESLDFNELLQGVLDSARLLVGANDGTMVLVDAEGAVQDFVASGLAPEDAERVWSVPQGREVYEFIAGTTGPLRISNYTKYIHAKGFTDWALPHRTDGPTFMAVPMFFREVCVGHIFMGDKDGGEEFTKVDEEIMVIFASQAALVIANARLHRDEQRARAALEMLIEASPVGIAVVDAEAGAPVFYNQEGMLIAGGLWGGDRPPGGLLESATYIQPGGQECSFEELPLLETLRAGETVRAERVAVRNPDGEAINVLVNATPLRWKHGELESFVAIFQDMTPLEEQERLRAEFLGMVSRELRAPLAAIKGSVTTLTDSADELGPAEMAQFFAIIHDHSDQMSALITDLLDVARIESGSLSVDPEPLDVYRLVDEARTMFLREVAGKVLEVELDEGLPLVMADRRRIVHVLGNLFSHATQYPLGGSQILVTAVREDVHVAISVAGVSRGASSELPPDPFSLRSGESSIDRSGLALAICKGIVEAHGGRIRAESSDSNLGARFTFTLLAAEAAAPAADSPQSQLATGRRVRVLVVDGDPQALGYVQTILTTNGYATITTSDPADLPRLIAWEKPHLVLLNLMLPGIDGIELMHTIRKTADIPVIFLSVYGQDEAVARALDMGAADYVAKPFSPTELTARVRAALRKQSDPFADEPAEPYDTAGLRIDYVQRRAAVDGEPVDLTATEYAVLYELAAHAPRVMTHAMLLQRAWGPERVGQPWLVRDIVKRLRHKLGESADNPTYIFTEPRVGYWMATEEASEAKKG